MAYNIFCYNYFIPEEKEVYQPFLTQTKNQNPITKICEFLLLPKSTANSANT